MQGACHMNFKATSPDGLVECACHGKGCSEIKCTWSHCDKTVQEAAEAPETCLTVTSDKSLKLKNSHTYFPQVQLHTEASSTCYCNFFTALPVIITKKESFMTVNFGREAYQSLKLFLRSVSFLNLLLKGCGKR